jgi:NAD(P)-dependent dehydrogenase (short-subunit alcohol dehydrogenase family)
VGRATALAFAKEGYDVALIARAAESLDAATAEVDAAGSGRTLSCPTDVAFADQVDAAAKRIEDELGPVDVWVNCAMRS